MAEETTNSIAGMMGISPNANLDFSDPAPSSVEGVSQGDLNLNSFETALATQEMGAGPAAQYWKIADVNSDTTQDAPDYSGRNLGIPPGTTGLNMGMSGAGTPLGDTSNMVDSGQGTMASITSIDAMPADAGAALPGGSGAPNNGLGDNPIGQLVGGAGGGISGLGGLGVRQ
jgi:hypothetical protein